MRPIDADELGEELRESYNELRKIYDKLPRGEGRMICGGQLSVFLGALARIKKALTLDVAPVVHGRWEKPSPITGWARCSNCGRTERDCGSFCPNCGAKMDGEEK